MSKHLEHLQRLIPDLARRRILDLGAGKGGFLIELECAGFDVQGIEYSPDYIAEAKTRAQAAGLAIRVQHGRAEQLPFKDAMFGFVNINEVIEHVENPHRLLAELFRVLEPGGYAYMSVPNRFGLKDQHFHLYFVNWLPRRFADAFISLFGRQKAYEDTSAGRQRLREMHYYTYSSIRALCKEPHFESEDIRVRRIRNEYRGVKRAAVRALYPLARFCYFDSFHLLLRKPAR